MAEYFPAYGPYQNEIVGFNPSAYLPECDTTLITEYVSDPLREKGTELSEKGQTMVQEQKKGLGKFGQFAVDLGSAATQMVLDVGLGVATGGGMALPAAIRAFGSSATEAAMAGADLDQQMLYAATSAAASYGIEQMCNVAFTGLKFIAPGVTDDVITAGVEKLVQKFVGNRTVAEAVKNIGLLILSGAVEGAEETLESILNPFLQQFSYNKNAKTVLQDPSLWADAAYEGLIGGILGIFGRGTNTAVDVVENLINNKTMPGEKLMEVAGVNEPEVLGAMAINEMANNDLSSIVSTGTINVDDVKKRPKAFCGRSAEEIAEVLTNIGYEVSIKTSTRSRSGAKIIQISNGSGKRNISQVQVSPGGGRHGNNAYVKISTTDQGIIKVVDGDESTYKTDGKETATIIFSGGNP